MRRVLIESIAPFGSVDRARFVYPLPEDEAHHVTSVLRARAGDAFEAIDGDGHFFDAAFEPLGKGKGQVRRVGDIGSDPARTSVDVTLEIAVLKGDAMDWVIEKCVELGVRTVVPLLTDHTVVQTGRKTPAEFRARWRKIADQSLKQCGRLDRLRIEEPIALESRFQAAPSARRLWADERERTMTLGRALASEFADPSSGVAAGRSILVGPEGGWSERESRFLRGGAANAIGVSLGPWVLRAETAALLATGLAVASMRNFR